MGLSRGIRMQAYRRKVGVVVFVVVSNQVSLSWSSGGPSRYVMSRTKQCTVHVYISAW
jgi:hypothetical protein